MKRYSPKDIEPKWQKVWEESGIYKAAATNDRPKKYILEYFPYPSGAAMHVGHVRNYTIGDAIARFNRMTGHNVLHPMGWDAFGLPAENYAIKNKVSPEVAIAENTKRFKQQLMQMGFSYDWSREINSSNPDYYRWTQWFFLLLHKKGLAYQQESLQWWCPFDKTVLANEQIEAGRCWRCGNEVEKKALKQWFFKITDYADRLLADLDNLNWSESIKSMQRNWIGKSRGAEINFTIEGRRNKLKVFTTRPDTLPGVTFMVIAPEHPLAEKIASDQHRHQVQTYVKAAQAATDIFREKTDREKTGVFTGAFAVNPINGNKIPIWIADYVLSGYGTGAIMAVPAHDERDYEFAIKFNLPVKYVVEPVTGEVQGDEVEKEAIVAIVRNPKTNQVLMLDWGPRQERFGGILFVGGGLEPGEDEVEGAKREVIEETGYDNLKFVKKAPYLVHSYYFSNVKNKNYYAKMRGILFELDDEHQTKTSLDDGEKNKFTLKWIGTDKASELVDDEGHKQILNCLVSPGVVSGEGIMTDSGKYNGLSSGECREKILADLEAKHQGKEVINYKMRDWLISRQRYWGAPIPIIHCNNDGAVPVPEDQLPVKLPVVESIEPSGDGRSPLANVPDFVNTTCPKCGGPATRETDTMDGFACSSWYFLRFADSKNKHAPFDKDKIDYWLPVDDYIGGAEHAVMHLLYARFWTKVMKDEGLIDFSEPFQTLRNQGMILAPDGNKMSKSKGNTIEPDGLIQQGYGADSIRIMELFIGPWNQAASWSVEGLGGAYRFLQRTWTLVQEYNGTEGGDEESEELKHIMHKTIKKVSEDMLELSFNTSIAALMECVNQLYRIKAQDGYRAVEWQWSLECLLKLLAPFTPHIAEELWQELGNDESIHLSQWPAFDDKYVVKEEVNIAVQVNGKVRAEIEVVFGAHQDEVLALAKQEDKLKPYLKGKQIERVIYVPDKLLSLVIN